MQEKTERLSGKQDEYDIGDLPEFDAGYHNDFAIGTLFKVKRSVFKVVYNAKSDCTNCCNHDIPFFDCMKILCTHKNFILFDEIPDDE